MLWFQKCHVLILGADFLRLVRIVPDLILVNSVQHVPSQFVLTVMEKMGLNAVVNGNTTLTWKEGGCTNRVESIIVTHSAPINQHL